MTREINDDDRAIARTVGDAFGGEWTVEPYLDEDGTRGLFLLSARDRPERGLTSLCTIGLSDHPVPGPTRPPLGAELVTITNRAELAEVLITAGFTVRDQGLVIGPGAVLPGLVAFHLGEQVSVPHLLLTYPFPWDEQLRPMPLPAKTVGWLLALPITDAELAYLDEHDLDQLEDVFGEADPDFLDLNRASVV